jgi:hypothetical protein
LLDSMPAFCSVGVTLIFTSKYITSHKRGTINSKMKKYLCFDIQQQSKKSIHMFLWDQKLQAIHERRR